MISTIQLVTPVVPKPREVVPVLINGTERHLTVSGVVTQPRKVTVLFRETDLHGVLVLPSEKVDG